MLDDAQNAARLGLIEELKELVSKGFDIEEKDSDGRNCIMEACINDRCEVASYLLDLGSDINSQDAFGYTPLHLAISGESTSAVLLLLENSADPNLTDSNGTPPLLTELLRVGIDSDIVKALLQAGSDIDLRNQVDVSPKSLAETMGLDVSKLRLGRA